MRGEAKRERLGVRQATVIDESGRRVSAQIVHCHLCTNTSEIRSGNQIGGLPDTVIAKKMKQRGWVEWRHHLICPDCQAAARAVRPAIHTPEPEPKEIEMAEPIRLEDLPTAITPDRTMKRRIVDLIGDNWDDPKGRYIGDASDESLSRELKCPRKWVTDIRVDIYGDNGGNEEIEAVKRDLEARIADIDKLVENAMKLAAQYEQSGKDLRELKRRVERIEAKR
jgi:hypothetical protein